MAEAPQVQEGPHTEAVSERARALSCCSLGLSVAGKAGARKRILGGVTISCRKGDLVAFMGPSGSGKTTALRLLAGKVNSSAGSRISGKVFLNEEAINPSAMHDLAGFIPQEDNLLATMTCVEAFRFAAELRLGRKVDAEERNARAVEMMKNLGLEKCANTKIGTPDEMIRGVSGGERRRVSIGVELLAHPAIVFADEPTSGLDAHNALEVISFFQRLCKDRGCLVITSIHQPNSDIFQMYNKLLLLAEGRSLFYGEPHVEAIERFERAGAPLPPMTNPADHFIYSISDGSDSSMQLKNKLHTMQLEKQRPQEEADADLRKTSSKQSTSGLRNESAPIGRQARALLLRHVRNQIRNPFLTIARYGMALFMGGCISIMWSGLGNNQRGIQDRQLLLMMSALLPVFLSILPTLQAFPAEKPTIVRECGSGMYSITMYSITRFIVELPVLITAPLLMSSLLFFITGLNNSDSSRFPKFYLFQMLCCNVGMGYGYLISTLAPNAELAVAVFPLVMLWEMLFSGGISCLCDMPSWLRWLEYLCSLRYALTGIWQNEYKGLVLTCDDDELRMRPDGTMICPITTGEAVLAMQDLLDYSVEECIVALAVLFVLLRVIAHVAIVRAVSSTSLLSMACGSAKEKEGTQNDSDEAPSASGSPVKSSSGSLEKANETDLENPEKMDPQYSPGSIAAKVYLESKEVTYSVPAKKGRKVLVNNFSISLVPGEMLAIMGTSGSGKTTSLRLLAGKQRRIRGSELKGRINANGRPLDAAFQDNAVFIPQNDAVLATMTVREALTLSACLRLPGNVCKKEKLQRVDEMISWLGLSRCQDTMVGTDDETIRGVSGGERRRVSIGMELLVDPAVCFADEPTSGLDAHTAMQTLQIMRQLAEQRGCLVALSIHQPSMHMLQLFTKVLLMAEGRMAYFGPVEEAVAFFSQMGYALPERVNPADHFMTVLSSGDMNQRIQRATDFEKGFKALIGESSGPIGVAAASSGSRIAWETLPREQQNALQKRSSRASLFEVLWLLMVRMWRNNLRNKLILLMRSAQQVVFALVIGLMYGMVGPQNMENDQAGVFKRQASFFFASFMSYTMSAMSVAQVFCSEKPSFLREYQSGFYSLGTYFLSRTIVDLPMGIFVPSIFAAATWVTLGWHLSFFDWWVIQLLLNNAGQGLGFILSAPANSVEEAMNLEPPFTMLNMLFAGFFINLETIPSFLRWLQYTSIMRYAFGATMWKEFDGQEFYCTSEELAGLGPDAVCPITNGRQVLELAGLDTLDGEACVWLMLVFFFVTRAVGVLGIWIWAWRKTG